MAGNDRNARGRPRQKRRLLAHRPVLAVERPQDELLEAGGGEELAVGGEAERAHARRIARHAHVLTVGDAPAVQHRLLHGGDQEFAVRAKGDAQMRALPDQRLRLGAGRVGKPERGAVVMRDRKPKTFRRKGEPRDCGSCIERPHLAFRRPHEGGLAGRPGDGAVGPERDVIDPAFLLVGRDNGVLAGLLGRNDLAVVAAGDDALAVGCAREIAPA